MGPCSQILQAVGLGPEDAALGARQFGFRQALLEVIPGFHADFAGSAFGLGLIRAQENMALDLADSHVPGDFGQAGSNVV